MEFSDLGEYLFCSQAPNGSVGSIYFKHGRIRLFHDRGPAIEYYPNIISFEIDTAQVNQFSNISNLRLDDVLRKVIRFSGANMEVEALAAKFAKRRRYHIPSGGGAGEKVLAEFLRDSAGRHMTHCSRGKLVLITLDQSKLPKMYAAVKASSKEDDSELRRYFAYEEPALAKQLGLDIKEPPEEEPIRVIVRQQPPRVDDDDDCDGDCGCGEHCTIC